MEVNKIICGDCLEVMQEIPDGSVDMVLTDPPYGTTACKWDSVIHFDPMWKQLDRVIKKNGAICLFGSEPFSSALRMSNIKNYKYDWVWDKVRGMGHLVAKKRPMQQSENISVFNVHNYYPQMKIGKLRNKKGYGKNGDAWWQTGGGKDNYNNTYYPKNIITFSNASQKDKVHPTQKPVALMEYLIRTYTNKNELVLDFTIGSGTTAVAAIQTGRNYIGIEQDPEYCKIANQRILNAQPSLF